MRSSAFILTALLLLAPLEQALAQPSVRSLAEAAAPAVVAIQTYDSRGISLGYGSGFFVDPEGLLVSNFHVVEGGVRAEVHLPTGAVRPVRGIVAFDADNDFVVLKVDRGGYRTVPMGSYAGVHVGDAVVAIGNPRGLEQSVSDGIVSQKREDGVWRRIQFTAPISPGSSGGPLLDAEGRAIGITTAYIQDGQNLNFAVPIDYVRDALRVGRHVRFSFVELEREASARREAELARFIAENFSEFVDRSRSVRITRPNAWRVAEDHQTLKDGTRIVTVMLAPETAHRAETRGYLSEGIRLSLWKASSGYVWSEEQGAWALEEIEGLLQANPGFTVTASSSVEVAGFIAATYDLVGENTNITEPEKTVFLFIARPPFLLQVELVSPTSALSENTPLLWALANTIEILSP